MPAKVFLIHCPLSTQTSSFAKHSNASLPSRQGRQPTQDARFAPLSTEAKQARWTPPDAIGITPQALPHLTHMHPMSVPA